MAIEVRPGVAHLGGAIFDQAKANRERFERQAAISEEQRQFENQMLREKFELEKAAQSQQFDLRSRALDINESQFAARDTLARDEMEFSSEQAEIERGYRTQQIADQHEREFEQWKRKQEAVYTAEQERKLAEYAKAKDWVNRAYASGQLSEEDARAAYNNIEMAESGVAPMMPQRVDEFEGISIMSPEGTPMQVKPNSVFTLPSGGEAFLDAEGKMQLLTRPDQMPSVQGPQNAVEWAEQRAALRQAAEAMLPPKTDAEGKEVPYTEAEIDAKIKEIERGYAQEMGIEPPPSDEPPPGGGQAAPVEPSEYFSTGISEDVLAASPLDGHQRIEFIKKSVVDEDHYKTLRSSQRFADIPASEKSKLSGVKLSNKQPGDALATAISRVQQNPAMDMYPKEIKREVLLAMAASGDDVTYADFVGGAEYVALVMRPDLGIPPNSSLGKPTMRKALKAAGLKASDIDYLISQHEKDTKRR